MTRQTPLRGEVWIVDFSPTKGREQAGTRPALVISADDYNRSPSGLVVVLPITRTSPRVPWHVSLAPGEAGLGEAGSILCDHLRSVSLERVLTMKGAVTYPTMEEVVRRLGYLMDL